MAKLKFGIMGAGWWSTFAHIPALQKHEGSEVVVVQKRDRAAAEKVARDFDVPHAASTLEEVLARNLDGLVIGTTPNVHYTQAKAALEAGLHVLIEKPMTLRVDEARELVELAAAKDLQFVISCPWHYTRHGIEARRRIMDGELGTVRQISILMTNFVEDFIRGTSTTDTHSGESYMEPNKSSYSDPAIAGGGQIYTQVSHVAAYLTYLTGQRPARVFAEFDNAGAACDLFNALTLRMEGGAIVNLGSVGAPMQTERQYEVRVFGDDGMLFLELWKGTLSFHNRAKETHTADPLAEDEIYPHEAPARNLVDAMLGREENRSPATLGLAAMEVIEAACQSADAARAVAIR